MKHQEKKRFASADQTVLVYQTKNVSEGFTDIWLSCPANTKIVTGGCNFDGETEKMYFDDSHPYPEGWTCAIAALPGVEAYLYHQLTAYALCANY